MCDAQNIEYLRRIKEANATCVRLYIEWSALEPSEGDYSTSIVVNAVENCLELGITPVVCLNDHSLPSWLVTKGGNWLTYQDGSLATQWATRAISYADDTLVSHWLKVVSNVSEAIAGLGASYPSRIGDVILQVSNEDHLAETASNMRDSMEMGTKQTKNASKVFFGDYSNAAIEKWRALLEWTYGSISALASDWNRTYESFSSIMPPINETHAKSWYSWRTFNSHLIKEFWNASVAAARAKFAGRLCVNMLPAWLFGDSAYQGIIPSMLDIECVDVLGINIFPFDENESAYLFSAIDHLRALYPEKEIWLTEINQLDALPDEGMMRQWFYDARAHGISGFVWYEWQDLNWNYTYGLTRPDGTAKPILSAFSELACNASNMTTVKIYTNASVLLSEETLVCSPDWFSAMDMCVGFSEGFLDAVGKDGSVREEYIGYITERSIVKGALHDISALVLASYAWTNSTVNQRIFDWVSKGGRVVADADVGVNLDLANDDSIFESAYYRHYYGELFGFREVNVRYWENVTSMTFAMPLNFSNMSSIEDNFSLAGFVKMEELQIVEGEQFANWTTGNASASIRRVGEGLAIYIGTKLGAGYTYYKRNATEKEHSRRYAALFGAIAQLLSSPMPSPPVPPKPLPNPPDVKVMLVSDAEKLAIGATMLSGLAAIVSRGWIKDRRRRNAMLALGILLIGASCAYIIGLAAMGRLGF